MLLLRLIQIISVKVLQNGCLVGRNEVGKTADKKPVKNIDLWQALVAETKHHQVTWRWVKGHSGHNGNDKADALANQAIDELLS